MRVQKIQGCISDLEVKHSISIGIWQTLTIYQKFKNPKVQFITTQQKCYYWLFFIFFKSVQNRACFKIFLQANRLFSHTSVKTIESTLLDLMQAKKF